MATMNQKIYSIGGQKVISTAIFHNAAALRRRSIFRRSGVLQVLSRLVSNFTPKDRPRSVCQQR